MINELAHMFRAKYPISIVVEVTEENFADVMEWTGGKLAGDDSEKWIVGIPTADDLADVGCVLIKNGEHFDVLSRDEWLGTADQQGLAEFYEPVHFDAPDEEG